MKKFDKIVEVALRSGKKIASDIRVAYREAKEEISGDTKMNKLCDMAKSLDVSDREFRTAFLKLMELEKDPESKKAAINFEHMVESVGDAIDAIENFSKKQYQRAIEENPVLAAKLKAYIDKIMASAEAAKKTVQDTIARSEKK